MAVALGFETRVCLRVNLIVNQGHQFAKRVLAYTKPIVVSLR
jgi:hypothetical protein